MSARKPLSTHFIRLISFLTLKQTLRPTTKELGVEISKIYDRIHDQRLPNTKFYSFIICRKVPPSKGVEVGIPKIQNLDHSQQS